MNKLLTSWNEFERTYFPKDYLVSLAKSGYIDELTKHILDNNIDPIQEGLIKYLTPKDIGSLLARISIERLKRELRN